jgi:hypothetical protein
MIVLEILATYVATGLVVAVAFLIFGVPRVLPGRSVTAGARLLLLPGTTALWPFVLGRWLKAGRAR